MVLLLLLVLDGDILAGHLIISIERVPSYLNVPS